MNYQDLYESRKLFEQMAILAPEYKKSSRDAELIGVFADKYCEAKEAGDDNKQGIYLACLVLKFWDQVIAIADKCSAAIGFDPAIALDQVLDCINAAMEYKAWKDPTKNTTAKACINTLLASRGAAAIIYDYNRDVRKANVNVSSTDVAAQNDEDEGLTLLDTTEDEDESPDNVKAMLTAESIVQQAINKQKLVESIFLDIIAFEDCSRQVKNKTTGKSSLEFWAHHCIQVVSELPDDYENYFLNRYKVNPEAFKAALALVRRSNRDKLKKFLDSTLQSARSYISL